MIHKSEVHVSVNDLHFLLRQLLVDNEENKSVDYGEYRV